MEPSIRSCAFWSPEEFPWCQLIESAFAAIKEELIDLTGELNSWPRVGGDHRETGKEDGTVLRSGTWQEIVLFGRGGDVSLAPRTCALLEHHIPDAIDLCNKHAGEIIFSALGPHTHISPHCAATNIRLTGHLGMIIPVCSNSVRKCQIRVGSEWRSWQEGRFLFFDDSFEHEVVNDTDSVRVVLLIRFWHPELIDKQNALDKAMQLREQALMLRSVPPLHGVSEEVRFMIYNGTCSTCRSADITIHSQISFLIIRCNSCKNLFKAKPI